jgi:hypothetical protein
VKYFTDLVLKDNLLGQSILHIDLRVILIILFSHILKLIFIISIYYTTEIIFLFIFYSLDKLCLCA